MWTHHIGGKIRQVKNNKFLVTFNAEKGSIQSLSLVSDVNEMNFVKAGYGLNQMKLTRRVHEEKTYDMQLVSFEEEMNCATAVFRTDVFEVCSVYTFTVNGNLRITNTLKLLADKEFFLKRGEWSIAMPFADEYPNARECMTKRCHTHIWCGLEGASYICCLKMGNESDNLGIIATKGGWESYSQINVKTNNRGCFLIHPDIKVLEPKKTYEFEYEIFPCTGVEDFQKKCMEYQNYIQIEAEQYSIFRGEEIHFCVRSMIEESCVVELEFEGRQESCLFACEKIEDGTYVSFRPEKTGEYKFFVQVGEIKTYVTFQVLPKLAELLEKRVRFIVRNQQYHKEDSPLDGAYLVYDNEEERCFYHPSWPDLNASRERVGMGILIASYLQSKWDQEIYESLMKYEKFIRREIYNDETGQIYDEVQRGTANIRLYNFLWVALFYTELFYLTKNESYLTDVYRIVNCYYEMGGKEHYPNAVFLSDFLGVLKQNEKAKEYEIVWKHFQSHVENILKNGCDYPKHEVNYEQTIVSPAVAFLLDYLEQCKSEEQIKSCDEVLMAHMKRLERFDGFAPHYKLNNVAIRFWDDFWFGKERLFGDTFPHYWSCLSSVNYYKYGQLTNDEQYKKRGESGMRNCLCLFFEDGKASCASVFPHASNGRKGDFYDDYANDQDFALYFAWRFLRKDGQNC